MTANLQNPIFTDETKAREWLEARVWPHGPVCPHCGATGDDVTTLEGKKPSSRPLPVQRCREQFTVTVKTVFERSKIPVVEMACCLVPAHGLEERRERPSSAPLARHFVQVGWFMMHRLREAMRSGGLIPPMGGTGKTVEADETYFGSIDEAELITKPANSRKQRIGVRRPAKRAVLALVERGGKARTFHIAQADQRTVHAIMKDNINRETRIHTDESGIYNIAPWHFENTKRSSIQPTNTCAAM